MKNTFTTTTFMLDLSEVQLSIEEENNLFSDNFTTKFTFPFTGVLTASLIQKIGNISVAGHLSNNIFEGIFTFEGKNHKARLEILSVTGDTFQGQIDFGFEDFPLLEENLDYGLDFSESATLVYYFGKEDVGYSPTARRKFPTLSYEKYRDKDYFEGFSHQINAKNSDGAFIENDYQTYISSQMNQTEQGDTLRRGRNRNIVQPMLYLRYVIEKALSKKGLSLSGDILRDDVFNNLLIYKPLQDYTFHDLPEISIEVDPNGPAWQTIEVSLVPGHYFVRIGSHPELYKDLQIYHKASQKRVLSQYFKTDGLDRVVYHIDYYPQETAVYELRCRRDAFTGVERVLMGYFNEYFYDGKYIAPFPLLSQAREWEQKALVPKISFSEVFKILKIVLGYTAKVENNSLIMNKLDSWQNEFHNRSYTATDTPEITFPEKKSTQYQFVKSAKNPLPSIYMDSQRIEFREKEAENTTELKLHILPINHSKKMVEIDCEDENALILFLDTNEILLQKEEKYVTSFSPKSILNNLKTQHKLLKNKQLRWSFIDKRIHWRGVKTTDFIFAFGQKIRIKSLNKTILSDTFCQVEIIGIIDN